MLYLFGPTILAQSHASANVEILQIYNLQSTKQEKREGNNILNFRFRFSFRFSHGPWARARQMQINKAGYWILDAVALIKVTYL
jgi:hypothetical protein